MYRIVLLILFLLIVDTPSNILPEEYAIVDGHVECAAGFNAQGSKVFEICGTALNVVPSKAQQEAIRGGVFTHSHVGQCAALSLGDINFAAALRLKEIRAVSYIGNRIVVVVAENPPYVLDYIFHQEYHKQRYERAIRLPGWRDECAATDAVWGSLAPKYGFRYAVMEATS